MSSSLWAVWPTQGSKETKVDLSFSEQFLRVFFFQLFVGKKHLNLKYCSARTKKLEIIKSNVFLKHSLKKKL
jgi:hypothetical protein